MIVLGWHGGIRREFEDMGPGWSTHDGAAALLVDGEVVAACEEERLNRVKHSNYFPAGAIVECLELAGIGFDQVDLVAMNFADRTEEIYPCDRGLPSVDLFLSEPARRSFTVAEAVEELFRRTFGVSVQGRLYFCHHHLAHLWSAWSCAGAEEALLVSLDGSGDCLSGMVGIGSEDGCRPIREFPVSHSLGNFYSDLIRLLGYRRFDEYKVMGLAPHGDAARFRDLLGRMYQLHPDGGYELIDPRDRWELLYKAGILAGARRAGGDLTDVHRDFAAALQETLETIVLHLLVHHREKSGQRRLCLAGGVAHNSSLNGGILRAGGFDSVFVQPAAHDAGGALGAALAADANAGGGLRSCRLRHVFLGSELGDADAIEARLNAWGEALEREVATDVSSHAAERLAAGDVVGWVQGRAEFGPRALGHRSLLADPRDPSNVARINGMIKNREHYRPFAPSVLEERLGEAPRSAPHRGRLLLHDLRVAGEARGARDARCGYPCRRYGPRAVGFAGGGRPLLVTDQPFRPDHGGASAAEHLAQQSRRADGQQRRRCDLSTTDQSDRPPRRRRVPGNEALSSWCHFGWRYALPSAAGEP